VGRGTQRRQVRAAGQGSGPPGGHRRVQEVPQTGRRIHRSGLETHENPEKPVIPLPKTKNLDASALAAVVLPLDSDPFIWENLNPQATHTYGEGFAQQLGLEGGWYDTVGNLYAYYSGKALLAGTDVSALVPELQVGTNRYASVWWDPYGIEFATTTNSAGVMTGIAASTAGAPAADGTAYDYTTPTNAVGLTIGLTRATGVFKGSFNAWFDYGTTHTSKTVAYEGALTPAHADAAGEAVAGRGFFLWANQAAAPAPAKPYAFSWSYDFKILMLDWVQ